MDSFMAAALEEAKKGLLHGGVPIGSVLVHNQQIVGRGHNQRVQKDSVILHAEMDALENAGRKSASYYQQCTLYTTLSPCPMCTGAVLLYGIPKVVIGENLNFKGEEDLLKARGVELEVLNLHECVSLMQDFIKKNPRVWNEDIGV
jgi:cytosine deaminase